MVKNLPVTQETPVQSLAQEYPLKKGSGNTFQYSCLENSMNRGAWWATVHVVPTSQTLLSTHTLYKFMVYSVMI